MAPAAYVSQPLWSHGAYGKGAYKCAAENMYSPTDGTPIIWCADLMAHRLGKLTRILALLNPSDR